jgi:hypothetical protein
MSMPTHPEAPGISPGQASYVIERLLAERRIALSDVNAYLADIAREIRDIEGRIATLRAATGNDAPRPMAPKMRRAAQPKRVGRPGRPSTMQLNGRYMGFYRQIPKYDQPKYSAIRKERA